MSKKLRKSKQKHFKMKVKDVSEAILLAIKTGELTKEDFLEVIKRVKEKI